MKGTSIVLAMILGVVAIIFHQIATENAFNKGKNEGLVGLQNEKELAYERGWKARDQQCEQDAFELEANIRQEEQSECADQIDLARQQAREHTETRVLEQSETEKAAIRDSFEQVMTQLQARFDSLLRDSLLAATTFLRKKWSGIVQHENEVHYEANKEEDKIHTSPDHYLESKSPLGIINSNIRISLMPFLSWIGILFVALIIRHWIFGKRVKGVFRRQKTRV